MRDRNNRWTDRYKRLLGRLIAIVRRTDIYPVKKSYGLKKKKIIGSVFYSNGRCTLFLHINAYWVSLNTLVKCISSLCVILVYSIQQLSNLVEGLLEFLRVVLLCGELMNEACLPFFWSRGMQPHTFSVANLAICC